MSLPQVTREKLTEILKSPDLVRAFEAIQQQLRSTPEEVADLFTQVGAALAAANAAQADADAAQADADTAQSTANTALANAATAQGEIDAHEALTAAHGATGAVVGTTNTQVLSGKSLDGPTPLTGRTIATGAAAAALTANKPGASTAVATWVTVSVNGTDYLQPLWSST